MNFTQFTFDFSNGNRLLEPLHRHRGCKKQRKIRSKSCWQNGIKFIFKGIYFTPEFCISFGFVWLKTLSRRDLHSLDIFSIICLKLCECTQRNSIISLHFVLWFNKQESAYMTTLYPIHFNNVSVQRFHNVQFSIIIFTSLRIVISFGISIMDQCISLQSIYWWRYCNDSIH